MSTLFRYYLPPPAWKPKSKRRENWPMTPEEAAQHGLTDADKVPASEETRQEVKMQSAGFDGVKPPRK